MRILKLQLLAYGPFTDCVLDFSSDQDGLHLVYGPNEAGKSSALRAIHGLLYGIPAHCSDDQLHDKKQLRIGAVVQNAAKESLRFHRRKGRKDTLLNPDHEQGAAYPRNVLEPYLGGIDETTFQRVYGISHEELQRGGTEMQSLRGLVGESLFAASVGGAGLADMLAEMEAEAGELFDTKKRNVRLKLAKRDYETVKKQRREAHLPKSRWEKLQTDLARANRQREEIVEQESELEQQLHKLRRIRDALKWIGQRSEYRQKQTELGDGVILPEHYSEVQRSAMQAQRIQLEDEGERLQSRLTGENSLLQQIAEITIADGLLDYADAISDLKDERAVVIKATKDREVLQRDCEQLRLQVEAILRDLGLASSFDEAERFRIAPDQRTRIQNLARDEKRLLQRPAQILDEKSQLISRIRNLQSEQQRLGEPLDVGELKRWMNDVRRQGDLDADIERLRRAVAHQQHALQTGLATLGLWSGSLNEMSRLQVPLSQTIDRFSEDFAKLHSQHELLQQNEVRLNDDLAQQRQSIAALQQSGHVPSESELDQIRAERDQLWRQLRSLMTADPTSQVEFTAAADEFEGLVARADSAADRLRREADRVAQLADRTARVAQLSEQQGDLSRRLAAVAEQFNAIEIRWRDEWSKCGVAKPLTPREMQSWLAEFRQLRQASQTLDQQRTDLAQLERRYTDNCHQLVTCLEQLGQSVPATSTLIQLLDQASLLVDREDANAQQRATTEHEVRQCQSQLEKLAAENERAADALRLWQEKWAQCMRLLGCDAETTADQANERLNYLANLFEYVRDIESKQKRIADIDTDRSRFDKSARRLADRFLEDALDLAPPEAALELSSALEKARSDQQRLQRLNEEVDQAQEKLRSVNEQQSRLTHELNAMCEMAGVENVEQLPEIERTSRELAECHKRLGEIDEHLHELSGGTPLEEFVASASQWNPDELHARIASLERDSQELRERRDQAVVAVRDLEAESHHADGNGESAEKDQQALGLISRMQQDAAHYMRLRLAVKMLRLQIEKHRAANEDPLFSRASNLFSRITCHEFSGIRTDFNDDQPVIVGVRKSNQELVPVQSMSDGTRDQLYLALRLGYVEQQLAVHEPMPFIVDDILIHYDDRRSQATLSVLAELSKRTQVIFFTHHWHLIGLAKDSLGEESCCVHHLDSRDRESVAAMAATRPR